MNSDKKGTQSEALRQHRCAGMNAEEPSRAAGKHCQAWLWALREVRSGVREARETFNLLREGGMSQTSGLTVKYGTRRGQRQK